VNRTDCSKVSVAADIDPAYAHAFKVAQAAGIDVLCYDTDISPSGITLRNSLPFHALD